MVASQSIANRRHARRYRLESSRASELVRHRRAAGLEGVRDGRGAGIGGVRDGRGAGLGGVRGGRGAGKSGWKWEEPAGGFVELVGNLMQSRPGSGSKALPAQEFGFLGGRLRVSRWVVASWWIWCIPVPGIDHQATIHLGNWHGRAGPGVGSAGRV